MSTYPNLDKKPELLNLKTKDEETEDLRYKIENHDHEKKLKSLKIDNE